MISFKLLVYILADAAQHTGCLFCCKSTLLTHIYLVQLAIAPTPCNPKDAEPQPSQSAACTSMGLSSWADNPNMGFFHSRCRTLHLPLSNFVSFLLRNSYILSRPLWMAALALMKMLNSISFSIDPWGMLLIIFCLLNDQLLSLASFWPHCNLLL